MRAVRATFALGVIGASLAACSEAPWTPPEGCEIRELDGAPRPLTHQRAVDLLIVLDDGVTRSAAVTRTLEGFSQLIADLSRSDVDADGVRDVPDWRLVRAAVVGSDRGALGIEAIAGCEGTLGRRARLRAGDASCAPMAETEPNGVLAFGPILGSPSDPASFDCLVAPNDTCALPQPLETALEILSPSEPDRWVFPGEIAPLFANPDGQDVLLGLACAPGQWCPHTAFPQEESLLVIVVITERDDCSLVDAGVLDDSISLPAACARAHALGQLRAIERYADGLGRRRWDPSRVLVAIQAGLPPDALTAEPIDTAAITTIAADPRLEIAPEGATLRASCTAADVRATPPARLLEMARRVSEISGGVVLGSICETEPDFVERLRREILRQGRALCFPPARFSIGNGTVLDRCVVRETLPLGARCEDREARVQIDVDTDGRQICALDRVGADSTTPGWFFDETIIARAEGEFCLSPHLDAVRVTGATTPRGAIDVSCRYVEWTGTGEETDVICDDDNGPGAPCVETMVCRRDDDRCSLGGTGLVCDPISLRCRQPCDDDAECPAEHETRPGVCDRRTIGVAARDVEIHAWMIDVDERDRPRQVCGTLACE